MAGEIKITGKLVGARQAMLAFNEIGYQLNVDDIRNMLKDAMKSALPKAEASVPRGGGPEHEVSAKGMSWTVHPPFAATQLKIKGKTWKNKLGAYAILGVRTPAFYVQSFLEKGTSKPNKYGVVFRPRRWLSSAFEASRGEMDQRMRKWIWRKLRRVKKRMAK